MSAPLHGIRILDLSRILAGPWATQVLADLGAEIIKIERPKEGDDTRGFGPPFLTSEDGKNRDSIYFQAANRGKRSLAIDFQRPPGQELVRKLADRCDVLIENYKAGALARLGLGYASLSARNPRLIYCSITGFGQFGPHRHRPGYDLLIEAMGGLMSLTGEPEGDPMKSGVPIADILTGLYGSTAVLGALYERERSGRGQFIDLALLDVQIATLAHRAASYLSTGEVPLRQGNAYTFIAPYQAFATSDGQLIVAVANDSQFVRFAEVLGLPELADDPRFRTNADRVRQRRELAALISERLHRKTTREWLAEFDRAGVPVGPIRSLDAVFADPHIAARDLLVDFKTASEQRVRVVGSPIRFSRTPVVYGVAPPALGQDTAAVLSDLLGLSGESIEQLRREGVLG